MRQKKRERVKRGREEGGRERERGERERDNLLHGIKFLPKCIGR